MASHLLGISGRKRSGKDTLASRLIEAHGFTRVAFADPLKATMLDLDPVVVIEGDELGLLDYPAPRLGRAHERLSWVVGLIGWERAKEIREVRRLLQAHGVAAREHLDPDVWVDAALAKVAQIPGPVVITDVRFPNEAERVIWDGGRILRVHRPGLPTDDLHVSETALDDLVLRPEDYYVTNDGTVEDLHLTADAVAQDLLS